MTVTTTRKFAGLIGYVPRTGGSLLTSPQIQNVITDLSAGTHSKTYKNHTQLIFVDTEAVVNNSNNTAKLELSISPNECIENGYRTDLHTAFAAFIYRGNGNAEVIEIREIEKHEFQKYVVPVTFHAPVDLFARN